MTQNYKLTKIEKPTVHHGYNKNPVCVERKSAGFLEKLGNAQVKKQ